MANDLSIATPAMEFTPEQVALIKRTVAVGATDDELQLFMYVARKTGLDPFTRQIYAIKRWNNALKREVMGIQTGIDGFRVTADRTGKLAGISDPSFDSEDKDHPNKATVSVKKLLADGSTAEFSATARWSEYVPLKDGKPTGFWTRMPYLMLGKCAEALAIRKAFPADLSGVYTSEEMDQADSASQGAAVFAEVERQKAQHVGLEIAAAPALPPELDWSYQKTTGVLLCRLVSVNSRKKKDGKGEYLTIQVNGQVGGKKPDLLTYFHESARDLLLASTGKIAKLETKVDGDFANVLAVLEVDGRKVEKSVESDETKARLLASTLDFQEDDLRELHGRYCNGNWSEVLVKLEELRERRASEGSSFDPEGEWKVTQ